jgi:hypothetical protein
MDLSWDLGKVWAILGRVHNIILITVTRADRERGMEAREALLLAGMGIQRVVEWSTDRQRVLSCPDQVEGEESKIITLPKLEARAEV